MKVLNDRQRKKLETSWNFDRNCRNRYSVSCLLSAFAAGFLASSNAVLVKKMRVVSESLGAVRRKDVVDAPTLAGTLERRADKYVTRFRTNYKFCSFTIFNRGGPHIIVQSSWWTQRARRRPSLFVHETFSVRVYCSCSTVRFGAIDDDPVLF